MLHTLALDIGNRRTGVAYADSRTGVPVPLAPVHHRTPDELSAHILPLIRDRAIGDIVIGLPLLPSGKEGAQARTVRATVGLLSLPRSVAVHFLDERYTTPRHGGRDPDGAAACAILQTYMDIHLSGKRTIE